MRFAKERALVKALGSRCCRVLPSVSNMARSPSFQAFILRSRQASFTFDFWWGAKIGRTVVAVRATDSRAEPAAKALYSLASSDLPTFPEGSLKQFFLQ